MLQSSDILIGKSNYQLIKSISISGPESSGKTWLTKKLAEYFNEPYSLEFARKYLESKNGFYEEKDLIEIAKGQIKRNKETTNAARQIAFNDTSYLDIFVWSTIKYGHISDALSKLKSTEEKTYYLLCAPNIEYESDELRESPNLEKRNLIYNTFYKNLKGSSNLLGVIDSKKDLRLKSAIEIIESKFNF